MIDVHQLTLQYENGQGVFDLDFRIGAGEVFGYLGPNGSGKTTTIRCLLGFMKVDRGYCQIKELDCFTQAPQIQKNLGYIPGESNFFEGMTGVEFLKLMMALRHQTDTTRQKELLEMFELDPRGSIKKYSKGMKQKLSIVNGFMHDPEILILDEPTSGLDPLMQNRFIELILAEKARGKTILMSSHMFEEVERTADQVLVIREGRIVAQNTVQELKDVQQKIYVVSLERAVGAQTWQKLRRQFSVKKTNERTLEFTIMGEKQLNQLMGELAHLGLSNLQAKTQTLEEIFLNYYGRQPGEEAVQAELAAWKSGAAGPARLSPPQKAASA